MSVALLKVPITLAAVYNYATAVGAPQKIPSVEERARYEGLSAGARLLQGGVVRMITPVSRSLVAAIAGADILFTLAYVYRSTSLGKKILHAVSKQPARPGLSPEFVLGGLVTIWATRMRKRCYRELGRLFTYELSIRNDHRLVTTGPYAVVRHPSYTALALVYTCIPIWGSARGTWLTEAKILPPMLRKAIAVYWVFVSSIIAIAIARAPKEEEMLRKEFGDEWDRYAKRVPYMFVPGVL